MKNNKLQAPFPYFGGKSRIAEDVWLRLGSDINNYIEPFCGSMAMLLHNEVPTKYETVNDVDGLLTNFWRAIKFAPQEVADLASVPPSELDMTARHNWVYHRKDKIIELQKDPSYYDIEAAAYWVYVRSTMIGSRGIFDEEIGSRVPIQGRPKGIHSAWRRDDLPEIFQALGDRLKRVTIQCGDWKRTLSTQSTKGTATPIAVFLDPPYQSSEVNTDIYEHFGDTIFEDVREWCLENGDDPELRIALCGYEGPEMPDTWYEMEWQAGGGFCNINSAGKSRGHENRSRERIWFSPHCIDPSSTEKTVFGSFLSEE